MNANPESARGPVSSSILPVQRNALTLAFKGSQRALELPFRQAHFDNSLQHVRRCKLYAILFFSAFSVLDAVVFPEHKYQLWFIRFGVVCPVFLAGLLLSYTAMYRRLWQAVNAFYILVTGFAYVAMVVITPAPESYFYGVGTIFCIFFGYTFIQARFITASIAGMLVFAGYQAAMMWLVEATGVMQLIFGSYFLGINLLGMLICYSIETQQRKTFLLVHLLELEKRKTEAINRDLENRVQERTDALQRINRDLNKEILERKQAEARLQRAQKMEAIGTLAGGVAHDLNNILSGLVGYPELLLMDLPKDSAMRTFVETIKKSGEKAAAIVQDMLTLARRGVAVTDVVNLNRIVQDYLESPELAKLAAAHPRATMHCDLDPELFNILGSPLHLGKTVMNLVTNAFEAMPDGGRIDVSTRNCYVDHPRQGFETVPEGEYVRLRVADTGIGIAGSDLERIFEPFYTKKRMGRSGTGLGMAVVWGTVKDHGAYIDARSIERQGTVFDLYFPVTRKDVAQAEDALPIERYRGAGETVLVVDDIQEQRDLAAGMLQRLGYRVEAVAGGREAVAFVRRQAVDVLVLDMIMEPEMDGLDTYREILAVAPGQKAIIASGFSESQRVLEAQRLGAGRYIRKPYRLEEIGMALREALGKSGTA